MSQFSTFYKTKDNGEQEWTTKPQVVDAWVKRYGEELFKAGIQEAYERIAGIMGPNLSKENYDALQFLMSEDKE